MSESPFHFLGYHVTKIHFERQNAVDRNEMQISHKINLSRNYFDDDPFLVEVVLDLSLETEDNSFSFFMRMKGGFRCEEGTPKDRFKGFAKRNAPAIMYPYARSIVTNYTAQANITPIILPTINFVAFAEEKEAEAAERPESQKSSKE